MTTTNETETFEPTRHPLRFQSADLCPRELAPDNYLPQWDNGPCIYDDGYGNFDEPFVDLWRTYFAGGSNRPHFILLDDFDQPHIVEFTGTAYDVTGPEYSERYHNAYDAFWRAETESGVYTNPSS